MSKKKLRKTNLSDLPEIEFPLDGRLRIEKLISWYPTMQLRWNKTVTAKFSSYGDCKQLQQLWQCTDGTQEWRPIGEMSDGE